MGMEIVAIDCVMVGSGRRGGRDRAGQVAVVNEAGKCLYNVYVKHSSAIKIRDYRTAVTGITPAHLANGISYKKMKRDVASWIRKSILVGHDLDKILKVLQLNHPDWNKRDTSDYWRFRPGKQRPSLNVLAANHLSLTIQDGARNPIANARAAMFLYKLYETEWDDWIAEQYDEECSDEECSDEECSDEEYSDEECSDEEYSDE